MLMILSLEIITKVLLVKAYLSSHFHMKDFNLLRFFFSRDRGCSLSKRSFFVSKKRSYYLLEETSTSKYKPIDSPIDPSIHFDQNLEESLADLGEYR